MARSIVPPRRWRLAAAVVLVGLAGAAVPARAGTDHAVTIVDFAFDPPTLTIQAGDTVTWTNQDPVVHTVTSTSGAFDSGDLAQGEAYRLRCSAMRTFVYLCTPHPTMTGTVVVEAVATAAPTASPAVIPNVALPAPSEVPPLPAALLVVALAVLALWRLVRSARG